jgi:cobalt/nickel transport system permease protein
MTLALDSPPLADSPTARLDPRWKLAALALAGAAATAVRFPGPAVIAFAAALLLAVIARLPADWLGCRLGALAVTLLPFAVIMPIVNGMAGARQAGLLAAKSAAVVTLASIALGTAPLPVNLHAARALRVPGALIHILLLSYRYLFVLADDLNRLRRAVRVRGFRPRMDRHTYRTVGHIIGTLVVRGTERADGVAHAMRCRGFDGQFRSLATFRTTTMDAMFLVVVVTAAVGLLVWDTFG